MRFFNLSEYVWVILGLIAFGYVMLLGMVYFSQTALLYMPSVYSFEDEVKRAKHFGFRMWPEEKPDYYGLVAAHRPKEPKGTILLFHGNAGAASDRFFYAEWLVQLGYRLILIEYPGYGARSGTLGERDFTLDAIRAAKQAINDFGEPIYVVGESLGCSMAASVAGSDEIPVKGVILITPWDTLRSLAQTLYWYFPAKWLVRDRYDNRKQLADFKNPVAMILAEKDEIVPGKHSQRLYDKISSPKKLWVIPGATHNSWPGMVDIAWWKEVMEFLTGDRYEV